MGLLCGVFVVVHGITVWFFCGYRGVILGFCMGLLWGFPLGYCGVVVGLFWGDRCVHRVGYTWVRLHLLAVLYDLFVLLYICIYKYI